MLRIVSCHLACRQAEGMSPELRELFQKGSLEAGLPPYLLLGASFPPVSVLPPEVCEQKLSLAFLKGYAGVDNIWCWPAVRVHCSSCSSIGSMLL